jgi:urease accessory protein
MIPLKSARKKQHFLSLHSRGLTVATVISLAIIGLFSFAPGAMAHHFSGGKIPDSFLTGFLSGLAHPIIGLDHFAFVVASGLMAVGLVWGMSIPIAFVLATVLGTALHLQSLDLPAAEVVIAGSVVLFGILLAVRSYKANLQGIDTVILTAIAAGAGIFHGYAYGEAIVGAKMMPLVSYLAGFTTIQLGIAVAAYALGNAIVKNFAGKPFAPMRLVGLAIAMIGVVFLSASVS